MKPFFSIVLFLISTLAYSGAGSGVGKIELLYVKPNANWMKIHFSREIVNPNGCEKTGFYIVELDDSKASDRFYSALLAAYAAQKDIHFWISGCSSVKPWGGNRPKVYDIYMQ